MRKALVVVQTSLLLSLGGCQPEQAEIGESNQSIIGGVQASVGDFPTVVGIFNGGLCTGTLVAPDWVLTAAHCIKPELLGMRNQDEVTAQTQVVLDSNDIMGGQGRAIRAAQTIPHPSFTTNGLGDNDIGLIKLATPVTDRVGTPINRLVADAPNSGLSVIQVGFGATQQGGNGAGRLFSLTTKKTIPCSEIGVSDANLLCFNQRDGSGKCQGDSGGPSFATVNGVERVVGVTSFGDQNCALFGADTRVDAELSFLYQHAPELACQGEGVCNEDCGLGTLPEDPDCQKCTKDEECADEEVCRVDDGRCIPAPFAPGGDGADCEGNTDCFSSICANDGEISVCTSNCQGDDDCFDGFECIEAGGSNVCWEKEASKGGCSSTGGSSSIYLLLAGLALLGLRRRRRLA